MPSQPPLSHPPDRRLGRGRESFAVVCGGILGSAARAGIGRWLAAEPSAFPVPTLLVNLVGSLLLGVYLARHERATRARWSLPFWAVGVMGSFTTFSAFSLDVVRLLDAGRPVMAAGYVGASVVGGLALALVGRRVGVAIP